jgi:hypothetical protein
MAAFSLLIIAAIEPYRVNQPVTFFTSKKYRGITESN